MSKSGQSPSHSKTQLKLILLQTQIKKGLVEKNLLTSTLFQYNFQRLTIKTLNTLAQYIKEKILDKMADKTIHLIQTLIKDFQMSLKQYRMVFPHAENDKTQRKSGISSAFNKSLINHKDQDQQEIDQIQKFMMSRNLNLQLNLLENQDESYKNQQRNSINQFLAHVNIKEKNFQNQIKSSNQHRKTFCQTPQSKSKIFFRKQNTLDVSCFEQICNSKQVRDTITSRKTIQQVMQGEEVYTQTDYNLENIDWKKMEIYCRKLKHKKQCLDGQLDLNLQELQNKLVEFSMQTQAQIQIKEKIRDSMDSVQNIKKKTKKVDRNKAIVNKVRSKGTKQSKKQPLQQDTNIKNTIFTPREPCLDLCFQICSQTIFATIFQVKEKSNLSSSNTKLYKPITIKDIIFSLQQQSSPGIPTMIKTGSYHKKKNEQEKQFNTQNKFSSSRTLMIDNQKSENKKNWIQKQSEENLNVIRKDMRQKTFNGFSQYNNRNKKNGFLGQNQYQKSQIASQYGQKKEEQIQNQQSNSVSIIKKTEFNKAVKSKGQNRRQSRFKYQANIAKQFLQTPEISSKFQSKRNSLQCMFQSQEINKELNAILPAFYNRKSNLSSQLSMLSMKKSSNDVIHQDDCQRQSSSRKMINQKKNTQQKKLQEIAQLNKVITSKSKLQNLLIQQKSGKQKKFSVVIRNISNTPNSSNSSKLKYSSAVQKHRKQATMYDMRKSSTEKQKQKELSSNLKLYFNNSNNSSSQISLFRKNKNYRGLPQIRNYHLLTNQNIVINIRQIKNFENENQGKNQQIGSMNNVDKKRQQKQSQNQQFKANPLPKSIVPSLNSQSSIKQLRKLLLTKKFRNQILLYLSMIQTTHQKYCGQNCIHLQNFYKDIIGDPKLQKNQTICSQILRVYKKNKT